MPGYPQEPLNVVASCKYCDVFMVLKKHLIIQAGRTFSHLKTVLCTLLNACIQYDVQSACYWKSEELLAIARRPPLLSSDDI